MHKLTTTNGLRILAHNLLHAPDTFKTPSEIIRAARLVDLLECPEISADEATGEWQDTAAPDIELTEPQRDLLKMAVEKHAPKLAPTKHVLSLLSQLGFE